MALYPQQSLSRKTVTLLLWVLAGLLLANLYSHLFLVPTTPLAKFLDVNREKNLATAFSGLLLLTCALLLGLIAYRSDRFRRHWWGLSALFCLMAVDECAMLHERLNTYLDDRLDIGGLFYYSWVIPGLALVLLLLGVFARFIAHLPRSIQIRFLLAGGIYVLGALGMEMISGYYIDRYGEGNLPLLALLNGLEESAEMVGLIFFIETLLRHWQSCLQRLLPPAQPK